MLKSEGNTIRVRDVSSVTWSSPLVTMSVPPSIFSLPAIPNPHTQHSLRLDPPPITPSRFASVNPFTVLSDLDDSPPAPVECAPAPPTHTQALSSISAPPIIADTGCTGLLLQLSNFPALSPFFTHKPLPLVPFTLPDRSVLLVGGGGAPHGRTVFPPQSSPCPCLFST